MRQLKATAALILTAFFAVAGAYHHHHLPRRIHDHTGLCSNAPIVQSLESCAICQATHTAADRLAIVATAGGLETGTPIPVNRDPVQTPLNASRLHGSRAPPTV